MADLAVLRTAKVAMSEELITQEDFDTIKVAFLKAQQIKAGLDAGFIREEDYVQARDAFLHSLDFRTVNLGGGQQSQPPMQAAPAAAAQAPPPLQSFNSNHSLGGSAAGFGGSSSAGGSGILSGTPRGPPPPPPPALAFMQSVAGGSNAASLNSTPRPEAAAAAAATRAAPVLSASAPSTSGTLPGTVPIPADLARIGRANVAAGKKSMSGIGLNDSCINIYNHIKTKSSFKWVTYKIDDAGAEVVPDQLGAADSTYDQFTASLPESQCRFAVFDYAYTNNDTMQVINKLVFLHWAPNLSSTKSKMMYASTKEFVKGYLDGVGAELQADTPDEITEAELRDRIGAAMTRK